jgi:hypothetical protein
VAAAAEGEDTPFIFNLVKGFVASMPFVCLSFLDPSNEEYPVAC